MAEWSGALDIRLSDWCLQCINGVSSNPVEGKTNICQLKDLILTLFGLILDVYIYIQGVDVVEWSRALDVRLSEWGCSVTMVWVQIPSREEQKFDSSKI